jgi:hypothetical protein
MAIPNHLRRPTTRCGYNALAHDQYTPIIPGGKGLNNNMFSLPLGGMKRGKNLGLRAQVCGNASALIAMLWLHNHRYAYCLSGSPRFLRLRNNAAIWNWDTDLLEQFPRQLLVLGNPFRNSGCGICLGCKNSALPRSMPKLNEAPFGQTPPRNPSGAGSVHNTLGAWTERDLLFEFPQFFELSVNLKGFVRKSGQQKSPRRIQCRFRKFLLVILNHHPINALLIARPRLAISDGRPCQDLELNGDVF